MVRLRILINSLTLRGKGLVAVGVGLAAGAVLSGQRDLLSVALVAILLPLLSFWLVSRTGFSLGCTRSLSSPNICVGDQAELTLTVENLGDRRTATLLLADAIPASMGSTTRRILPAMSPGERRRMTMYLLPQRRGSFAVGPLRVIAPDPLGLVRVQRAFRTVDSVLVTPRVVPLTAGSPHAEHLGRGDATLAALAARGDDDVVPREYRVGDDLRRVHWRASARTGQMMVRREEQPWTRQAVIIIDDRRTAHVGYGPNSSFENALSAAASIGVHLLSSGFDITLVGLDGNTLTPRLGGRDGRTLLLNTLAAIDTRDDTTPRTGPTPTWHGDFVVAIVTATDDMASILGVQHPRRSADLGIALVLDPADWSGGEPLAGQVVTTARHSHWQAVHLPRFDAATSSVISHAWTQCLTAITTDRLGSRR
jgi:uncharacterized protein (DUF58 family)